MAAAAAAAAAGAAACGLPGRKPQANREASRRNRENSRRRQAALLFLSNISLDGRPVLDQPVLAEPEPESRLVAGQGPQPGTSAGFPCVPSILVLPSDSGSTDPCSAEVLLGSRRGSFPSPGSSHLLSPSNSSLLPSPVGPRKSSTLLSVQSCSSVSSEPRQR